MAHYDDYDALWDFDGLNPSQENFIHSQEIQNLYDIAWDSKIDSDVSHDERVNARDELRDMFYDAGMDFDDVFDFDQWLEDMGYAEAA